jgi:hypothetical protein
VFIHQVVNVMYGTTERETRRNRRRQRDLN